MNRTTLVAGLAILGFGAASVWALAGGQRGPFAILGLALALGIVLLWAVQRQSQQKFRRTHELMQQDRRTLIAELRQQTQKVEARQQDHAKQPAKLISPPAAVGNTFGTVWTLGGIGPDFDYAERIREAPGSLATFALRVRSTAIRDAFSRSATNMQFSYEDVLRILRSLRAGRLPGTKVPRSWERQTMLTLARLVANQRLREGDLADASAIFFAVEHLFGVKALGKSDVYCYVECLSELGHHTEAMRILRTTGVGRNDRVHQHLVQANAFISEANWDGWLSAVNELYAAEELAPVALSDASDRAAMDRLKTVAEPRSVEGPLVTIIVPTFNGSDFIETTLRCLTEQTWRNLEIIVVDDCSAPEHQEPLAEICSRFSDVILVHQEKNMGAYPARNRALAMANGEFITVHDDDDWSHAQKIEVQARYLLDHPEQNATMTRHARATDGLVATRINNNPQFSQPNFSSLMFRKELTERIGIWDEVNRGADAEFRDRLVKLTGQPVEVLYTVPMSFTRTHAASLTAGEMARGYVDPSRLFYQSAYLRAHASLDDEHRDMPDFARPLNMLPGNRGVHLGEFDVLFATDFTFPGGTSHLTINEIEQAADSGLRVGVVPLASPVNSGAKHPNERLYDAVARDNVEILSLSDEVHTSLVVVRHATVLQFAENLPSNIAADRAVVIINNPPVLTGGRGYVADFAVIRANAARLFGVEPEVLAESGVTKVDCLSLARPHELSAEVWPGFIDIDRFTMRTPRFDRKPVLGRHSRDAALKWPDRRSDILAVYGSNDVFDARILGGVDSLPQATQQALKEVTEVLAFGSLPPEEFLQGLDFWAYFHSSKLTESFGMATVEAMASGIPVILPEYMKVNFGAAAIYATPATVQEVVAELWADPMAYQEQAERGRRAVETTWSRDAFLDRLKHYGVSSS